MTGRTCMYGYCTREHDEKGAHVKGPPATRHLDTDDATVGEREHVITDGTYGWECSCGFMSSYAAPWSTTQEQHLAANSATPPDDDANRAPVSGGLDEGEREATEYAIVNDWLVEVVNEHTCGTGSGGHYGAHEPGCGMVPVANIAAALKGERDTARREAGERIAVAMADEFAGRVEWEDGKQYIAVADAQRIARNEPNL